jgi:dTDP-4-dehydrorhamnose reductase
MDDERILITGAGGMLGRSLTQLLEARGRSPLTLDRGRLDIGDEASVARVFAENRPTLLLNCAAHTKVDLCEEESARADAINGHAVGTLAKFCREYGTTMVHYSTDFVFDGRGRSQPYRADEPTHPISAYGRSKLLGETELQANPPPRWLIVRTAWAYGAGGANFPRVIVERARQGQPLKIVNDEVGSPTYTHDLAEATLDLLETDAAGVWHVTNSGEVSRFDYARAILEEFGLDGAPITPITTAEWLLIRPKQACRPAYSVLDVSAVAQKLGRPMRPWREALRAFKAEVDARGSF